MNKLLSLSFVALLAAAGCRKSVDLGRMQEESLVSVQSYDRLLATQQQRAEALLARGRKVASSPGVDAAGKHLTEARARLEQLRGRAQTAATAIAAAAKSGVVDDLRRTTDELHAQLDDGLALLRADLDAVDSWVSNAEKIPRVALPPQPPTPPDETEPPPDEAGGPGDAPAAPAAGAAAPVTPPN